ncbi:PspC domain-containing protein [Agathobaculum sp.]|jgi:phage shock protein C|uniref:PspC domain-containing protein n=1 Tax=Agathobaculum sp. TaxID=2048138 RepID=UPI000E51B09A|nr:PspC domain-containing protein [uncultured Agathobaculum sp.]RHS83706.1 PspC domain-containing protein [Butyricicoccus sp. AM42-5AC]RHT58046.1 PspC domain-containing protein [Butyricicoccus sp. AM29-23AC]RHV43971.1 PspC domain-containing protein [Butyricicoccus sp. OM04-18BH]
MNGKRLYRSESNRMLCGVCAGIAEYFNLDPTLIRLAWALFCVLGGSGVLAYILAAIIIPPESRV